ncbi:NAD(P)-dependent alcohol dehydrogenase [Rhodococcus sp. NPDC059968]|uniref:NAD(P)-dependent alcohol dehydrogenase n=1 Tax=Rhodococcus sp. NPDC059968 TaxID=3347017 RepID=UPI00367258C3
MTRNTVHGAGTERITAAVVREKNGDFIIETLERESDLRLDEVLVRVVATGLCQTDVHVRDQNLPTPLPAVLGHEGSGVVEAVGAAVQTVAPGDHVTMSYQSCGHCRSCLTGYPAYCERSFPLNFGGARADGTNALRDDAGHEIHGHFFGQSSFATHAVATERNVVKVPVDAPLELLGPLGCGIQTGAGAIMNSLAVPAGASVVVFGAGAVGLSAIMAAHAVGASPIIAVDVVDERLILAEELGATHTVNARTADVSASVRDIAPGGVDFALEITGRPSMLTLAVDVLAPLGTAGLIGGAPAGTQAPVDMNTLLGGRTVRGIAQGDSIPQLFIPELIKMHQAGRFPFDRLVTFYDFADINTAVADTQSGKAIKPILRIPTSHTISN